MRIERDAFYSMLGIAKRAGALTLGTDGVLTAIASGSVKLVLLHAAASENTKKKFHDSCAFYGIDLYETAPDRLVFAIGKPGRMCAGVAKGPLGDKLHKLAQEG